MQNFRQRLFPKGSLLEKIAKRIYYLTRDFLSLGPLRRGIARIIHKTGIFTVRYFPEDFGYSILYTDQVSLFPNYPFREKSSGPRSRVKVTLISTTINETPTIQLWMECIFQQSRLPDEIVIVDGGSIDGTSELLRVFEDQSPIPMHIIYEKGCNIAQGRNIAIAHAEHPIIAVTDFGCRPVKDWLEKIIAPFERDSQIQLVGGWYIGEDHLGNTIRRNAWPTLDQVDPDSFIPSSRSIAFTKEVWEKAHGYPEWLSLTGEDTYFALELRRFCGKRAFAPDAIVKWQAPESATSYWKKIYNWSVGDGESGLHSEIYLNAAKRIILVGLTFGLIIALLLSSILFDTVVSSAAIAILILVPLTLVLIYWYRTRISVQNFIAENGEKVSRVLGFLKGASRRKAIDLKRFQQTNGIIFILAGVPIHDTGGGSRGAQIALEFLRQNYLVTYINKYESFESTNLGLRFDHPNLLLYRLKDFSWAKLNEKYGEVLSSKPCGALIEFPLKDFLPLVDHLHQINAIIVYDLLDDWDTQLGSTWYAEEIEARIISTSDVLTATAPVLAERLASKSGKPVSLLPNAVNLRLFDPRRAYIHPYDMPSRKEVIIYIGALWGEWFDWDLLVEIAKTYAEAAVVVIGDYRGQCPISLPNLHFLGLKPQNKLPSYLAYSNVAIIPWKEGQITYAVSPLKLYEYLAMHVPVVVSNLPTLYDIPCVYTSMDKKEFIDNIGIAINEVFDVPDVDRYITKNSWEFRVKELVSLMGFEKSGQRDHLAR